MVDGGLCERCHIRSAVAQVRRLRTGRPPVVERLCDVCLQEGQLLPGGGWGGLFEEFLSGLSGGGPQPGEPRPPMQHVDLTRYLSDTARGVLQRAAEQARQWGSAELDTDHLLWAVLDEDAIAQLLRRLHVEPEQLRSALEHGAAQANPSERPLTATPDLKRTLLAAFEESRRLGAGYIGALHLLLGLSRDQDAAGGRVLAEAGIDSARLRAEAERGAGAQAAGGASSATPTLDEHSRDLTALAAEGQLDPVIGRANEVEQAIEVLSRRTKNNPVLIGDPGVGKTAIVEGIAQQIASGEVPETLAGRRLVALDLGGLLAGTRYRGEFEQRLKSIIDEIRESEQLILFIDELHTVVGAGAAEGAMDASNMLKPALARGELHVIGATTLDEYRKNVERDAALERRFQPIIVGEPSVADTVEILTGLRDRYEAFHRVRITDEAITAAAELSERYVTDRFLPDKAIDVVDQASARVKLRHPQGASDGRALREEIDALEREKEQAVAEEDYARADELKRRIVERRDELAAQQGERHRAPGVEASDIAEVIARATGIPVAQLTEEERDRLLSLEQRLHQRVIGQQEPVRAVAEAVRRNRAGLGEPNRPVGSFVFLGPTGVGKTELARALAEALFGDEELMVRLDMSEYQERHTVARLVGAPPGYVGYEEAGQLTERVRRQPYSVLLLDEIEKAHPDVFNLLLQLLEDGRLTDAQGRVVDFANAVVIMTSNIGAERIQGRAGPIGFTPAADRDEAEFARLREDLMELLRSEFRPEFLNRIDEIVLFRQLDSEQLREITGLLLERVGQRLQGQGIELAVDEQAIALLAEEGFDPHFGARPLRRTIQQRLETELSRMVLEGAVERGDRVSVGSEDGQLRFAVEKGVQDGGDGLGEWEERDGPRAPVASGPGAPRD